MQGYDGLAVARYWAFAVGKSPDPSPRNGGLSFSRLGLLYIERYISVCTVAGYQVLVGAEPLRYGG